VNAQLQVLGELLVELGILLLVLRQLEHEVQALLGDVLLNHLQNLVLQQAEIR
jgi:hypothetical protein